MTDFSLLELREFISVSEKHDFLLKNFSPISLRLALQRVCEEMKIKQFNEFMQLYTQSSALRYAVKHRINTHPRELCRDVAAWQMVVSDSKEVLADSTKRILIFDNSFMAESASFFVSAAIENIDVNANVDWYSSLGELSQKRRLNLSTKELEAAQANVAALGIQIAAYLYEEGNYSVFDFPQNFKPAAIHQTEDLILPVCEKYDLIISQNNSLVYNFSAQELFFRACYNALTENGALFFGSKENVNNSSISTLVRQPFKTVRYYKKHAK